MWKRFQPSWKGGAFTMIVKSSQSSSVDITPAWCWRRARGWSSPCRRWRGRRCWGRSPPAPPRTGPATAATPCASSSGRRAALQSGSRKHCNSSRKCRYRTISWPFPAFYFEFSISWIFQNTPKFCILDEFWLTNWQNTKWRQFCETPCIIDYD